MDLGAVIEWAKGQREHDEHVDAALFAIAETMNLYRGQFLKKKG